MRIAFFRCGKSTQRFVRWSNTRLPDPFAEFDRLQGELSRLFGVGNSSDSSGLFDRYYSAPVDVVETSDEVLVLANVPRVDKKDIDLREEAWTGNFQRTISLPSSVDHEAVSAELVDGVLRVRVGKRAETKPRQIAAGVAKDDIQVFVERDELILVGTARFGRRLPSMNELTATKLERCIPMGS